MGILTVLTRNLRKGSRTRRPADRVPYPKDFRGALVHDLERCVGCGTCSYVCSPGAIVVDREPESASWTYDAGRCTSCGRCVDYCPTRALSFAALPNSIAAKRFEQLTMHEVEYQPCARCGTPITPIPVETLLRLYHHPESAQAAAELNQLCERCRGRRMGELVKAGLNGSRPE